MKLLAIFELLVFMGVVAPGFEMSNFVHGGWAGSDTFSPAAFSGIFAAIPFAIWFFLAIEGAAMAAEEAKDPKRTIPRAYITGILTLVVLAFLVMIFAGGVGDWSKLSNINDPLPQAMKAVVGNNSSWMHMLVWIGLFGLVASFHGIILGYDETTFGPEDYVTIEQFEIMMAKYKDMTPAPYTGASPNATRGYVAGAIVL